MAQVLLSAYNGDSFQLDVAALCNLDTANYEQARNVIRGRYELSREPQEMIPSGSAVFHALRDKWAKLELTERAKVTCPDCDFGRLYKNYEDSDDLGTECTRCGGTGRICACKKL